MYKRLLTNSAIYGILPQLPKVAALFVLPLTTPFLTQVDYGVVGTISSYTYATSVFQFLGLEAIIQNGFYQYPGQYKWFWRQLYGFLTVWSIVYIAFLVLLLYNVVPPEAAAHRMEIVIIKVLPLLLFVPSDYFMIYYYMMNQKAMPIASRSLILGFVSLALNYYFIAVLKMGYMGWFWSDFITGMVIGIVFCYPLYTKYKITPILNFRWRVIKRALKVSMPLIPVNYSAYILDSSDRVIMERYNMPTSEIGRYSLAYNFGKYVETVTLATSQALGPILIENIKYKKWREYEKLTYFFQALVLIGCFTLALWIPFWLPLLVRNKELLNIQYLMVIIIMSYSYRPIYAACIQIAYYNEQTRSLWRIVLTAGLINIVLNLVFLPIYGLAAAAISTFIAFMFVGFTGFTFKFYRDIKGLRLIPLFWLVMISFLAASALYLLDANVYLKLGANFLLIVFLLLVGDRLYLKGGLRSFIRNGLRKPGPPTVADPANLKSDSFPDL